MPRAKFFYGTKAQLDAKPIENGGLYMTTDENKWYIDMDGTRHQLTNEQAGLFSNTEDGMVPAYTNAGDILYTTGWGAPPEGTKIKMVAWTADDIQ